MFYRIRLWLGGHKNTLQKIYSDTPRDVEWSDVLSLLRFLKVDVTWRRGDHTELRKGNVMRRVQHPRCGEYAAYGTCGALTEFFHLIGVSLENIDIPPEK